MSRSSLRCAVSVIEVHIALRLTLQRAIIDFGPLGLVKREDWHQESGTRRA